MKLSAVLLASLMLVPTVSFGRDIESQGGYSKSRSCYRKEYRDCLLYTSPSPRD